MEENKKLFKGEILPFLTIACAIILTYLPYFKNTFGIDTSTMIKNQGQMLNGYLSQGRFGMVWIFEIFIHHYNNQIVPFIVIPLLVGSGIYLYFILKKYDKRSSDFAATLFAIAFICNPVVYAQLYFKMQAVQMIVGLFCVLLGVNLSLSKLRYFLKIIGSSLLFAFSLLIYQVFIFFIFSMILFCFYFFKEKRQRIVQVMAPSWFVAGLIYFVSYFMASLMINYSSYGNETYMMWNKLNELSGFQKLGVSFIALFTLAYMVLLIITIRRFRAKKEIDLLSLILLIGSIFTFNMAFGNFRPAPRVYFGTFSTVFSGLLYLGIRKGNRLKYLSFVITLFSIFFTFSLAHKANLSYENDQMLSDKVVKYAQEQGILESKTNLVFIGNLQRGNQGVINKFQAIFITGATRVSFFQFDPPLTSLRPYDFMEIKHYHFKIPDQKLRANLSLKYEDLPNYPSEKSIFWDKDENALLVKLSD